MLVQADRRADDGPWIMHRSSSIHPQSSVTRLRALLSLPLTRVRCGIRLSTLACARLLPVADGTAILRKSPTPASCVHVQRGRRRRRRATGRTAPCRPSLAGGRRRRVQCVPLSRARATTSRPRCHSMDDGSMHRSQLPLCRPHARDLAGDVKYSGPGRRLAPYICVCVLF